MVTVSTDTEEFSTRIIQKKIFMGSRIHYLKGDATNPTTPGCKIIAHVCNNIKLWGMGFVLAISEKWPRVKRKYMNGVTTLGEVQFIQVEDEITVCNMIAQNGVRSRTNHKPLVFTSLNYTLTKLGEYAREIGASVHMPRIGCGLAGAKWEEVCPLVEEALFDLDVYVYDL